MWRDKLSGVAAARRVLSSTPRIYIPIRRFRFPDAVASKKTHLLIEGFPRSGNTWAEALLREAGGDGLTLAHHSHSIAHIIYANSINVPSLVLYRNPDDAVASLLEYLDNGISAKNAFIDYAHFYRKAWRLRGPRVRFYSFEEVTQHPHDVVRDIAQAYNLQLSTDHVTNDAVFRRMDEKARRVQGNSAGVSFSRPDVNPYADDDRRQRAEASVRSPSIATHRKAAKEIYSILKSDLAQL